MVEKQADKNRLQRVHGTPDPCSFQSVNAVNTETDDLIDKPTQTWPLAAHLDP